MSVELNCPNCGGTCGYADSSDGYQQKWIKADDKGQPECPHCGAGESMVNFERKLFIGFLIFLAAVIILIPLLS
jgi:hypothetical protein